MSYTPTNWKAGDIVTSAKLNKIEQGIAASGGIRIVHWTMDDSSGGKLLNPSMQLDITPNELIDAFENEEIIVVMGYEDARGFQSLMSEFYYNDETYIVTIENFPEFTSSDPDEYFIYDPSSDSSGDDDSGDTIPVD